MVYNGREVQIESCANTNSRGQVKIGKEKGGNVLGKNSGGTLDMVRRPTKSKAPRKIEVAGRAGGGTGLLQISGNTEQGGRRSGGFYLQRVA